MDIATKLYDRAQDLCVDQTLAYHNWRHVEDVVRACDVLTESKMSPEMLVAAAFHDIVYVPGAPPGINEDLSFEVFRRHFRDLGGRHGVDLDIDLVAKLIDATKVANHVSPYFGARLATEKYAKEIAVFLDADLSGLAEPWEMFMGRQKAIVREFVGPLHDGDAFNEAIAKSARFLEQFLDKPSIYLSDAGRTHWEAAAVANIEKLKRETAPNVVEFPRRSPSA